MDKRAALHCSRPLADQSGKRVHGKLNGEVVRQARHPRSILVTSYEDVARVGRVRQDATRMLRGNFSRGI